MNTENKKDAAEPLRSGRLFDLARRWSKDADQYQLQVEEARSKGLPHDQMLSMMTALRQCSKELGTELGRSNTKTTDAEAKP